MKEPKNSKFKSFSEFEIEEKMGVPSGIVKVADDVAEFVAKTIAGKGLLDNQRTYNKVFEVENPHPELPLKRINLKIEHQLLPMMNQPVVVEGNFVGDSMVEDSEHFITVDMGVQSKLNLMFTVFETPNIVYRDFLTELQGLFYHELLHVYEDYHRTRKDKFNDMLHTRDFISASVSNMIRGSNPQIHPLINNFLFCVYASASFEVRARVSQVYPFIKDVTDYKDREKIIKDSFQWNIAVQLASFDAKEYVENLLKLMKGDESKLKGLTRNLEDAIKEGSMEYSKMLTSQIDSTVSSEISSKVQDRIKGNAKSFEKIDKDPLKFFTEWQKKFNREGEKAKRKLSKLVSI
jgi:hypothetical protein